MHVYVFPLYSRESFVPVFGIPGNWRPRPATSCFGVTAFADLFGAPFFFAAMVGHSRCGSPSIGRPSLDDPNRLARPHGVESFESQRVIGRLSDALPILLQPFCSTPNHSSRELRRAGNLSPVPVEP